MMKTNSTLMKRIYGAIAVLVALKFLFDTYTHGYIKSKGGNIITQENDPLSFYSIVIFFIFVGVICLLYVLGIIKSYEEKPITYNTPTSDLPPIAIEKLEQKLKSVGKIRALFFMLYTALLFLLATILAIHKFYVFIALLLTIAVIDKFLVPRFFCCPSCENSIWQYTTKRLKVRKLKILPQVTQCPKCGVLYK